MKAIIIGGITFILAMFIFIGVMATSSYKRDMKVAEDTAYIEYTLLPNHYRVYQFNKDNYTCFVVSSGGGISCVKSTE